ncbi:hypothetical protein [Bacteroides uniformis]|uniref:Fimbrillin family protein n=1 Tax=Bacteroides uniformis TaxID=820 RepID=A0AA37NI92_BACUN|nr:hypothetical protein [Bacteroides uniformis]GKH13582.1 hypothetical protein CE91St12_17920 [Bacteroides uniformis]GKH36921.1 hypothetical protein CE91St13_17920 [Bacteroides uniformis]
MKKRNLFFALAAGMVMFSACSNDDDVINGGNNGLNEEVQQLVLQVASSGDGLQTRAGRPLLSSDAKQTIENVKVIICNQSGNVSYVTSFSDWQNESIPYSTNGHGHEKTIEIPKEKKLAAGKYTVYAFGYSNSSDYNLTTITNATEGSTFNANTTLSFKKDNPTNEIGEEIFAGDLSLTVETGKGFKTPVVLNRQVAGTFAYLKDIPYIADASKLQLVASNRNSQLVLGKFGNFDLEGNGINNDGHINYVVNGTEATQDKVIYTINLTDWFTSVKDDNNDGLIDGDGNWIAGGHKDYASGSVFGGSFLIPFKKDDNTETFKLQLTKANGTDVLREWVVKLPADDKQLEAHSLWSWNTTSFTEETNVTDDTDKYSVVRNHLYGIGKRTLDEPTNPGTDPDEPESLNTKQELTLRVNDNWEVIHNMEIE